MRFTKRRLLICIGLVVLAALSVVARGRFQGEQKRNKSLSAADKAQHLASDRASLTHSLAPLKRASHQAPAHSNHASPVRRAAWISDLPGEGGSQIQRCQVCTPAAPRPIFGVDCTACDPCDEAKWKNWRPIPWQQFAQGEYVGPARLPHVPEYRLRVDDVLEFVYRLTREQTTEPYELNVGDQIRLESLTDEKLDRALVIQPDGTITLRLLGQVQAAGRTVVELQKTIEELYKKYYKVPAITITPVQVNTKLQDLRDTVDRRAGQGGQLRIAVVTPEGTVQLPGIGSVFVMGLTLEELKREVDARYAEVVKGIEVTPVLTQRAPRFVFVLGEVQTPGRFNLTGPTTVMGAIALAGGWIKSGNLRQIVVFRRAADWRLLATRLDLRGALLGKRPCPADEIWVRDNDIIVIPKMPIALVDDFVELVFIRGVYGAFPHNFSYSFNNNSSL